MVVAAAVVGGGAAEGGPDAAADKEAVDNGIGRAKAVARGTRFVQVDGGNKVPVVKKWEKANNRT